MENHPRTFFMSYKRNELADVRHIERALSLRGIRLWRDLEYLPAEVDLVAEIKKAIISQCDGFFVYVTPLSLISEFIWQIEIPTALERKRISGVSFPLVPFIQSLELINPFINKCQSILFSPDHLGQPIVFNGIDSLEKAEIHF